MKLTEEKIIDIVELFIEFTAFIVIVLVIAAIFACCASIPTKPTSKASPVRSDVAAARAAVLFTRYGFNVTQSANMVTAAGSLRAVQADVGSVCDCGSSFAGDIVATEGVVRVAIEPRGDSCTVTVFVEGKRGFIRCGSSGRLEDLLFRTIAGM